MAVEQKCSGESIEFRMKTDYAFKGRIFTPGYYDQCYVKGQGQTNTVLQIMAGGSRSYPDCGTLQSRDGDMFSNVVVVQQNPDLQTNRDRRFNITCMIRGPGETIVQSDQIISGSGAPIPIDHLPAINVLENIVRLIIMRNGRETTTVAVGDPLTFKLQTQRGSNLITDIFATDVIAKDPYSNRIVQLIDHYGCPVDQQIFPSLKKAQNGDGLEAHFAAFKIPETDYLVFEARVRACRR